MDSMLRLPDVMQATGLSRASVYLYAQNGLLTRPIKIGERSAAWPESEIDAINRARIAGKSENDIKVLVTKLLRERSEQF
jgi:prophage regulatory protein